MKIFKRIFLTLITLLGLFVCLIAGIMGYGLFSNSTKSLELTAGNATTMAAVDQAALEALVAEAENTHTDGLVVLKNGQLVGAWHSNGEEKPMELMSITKSLMNLIVGRAYTMGHIESLDEPMSTYIPEWAEVPYSDITVRHVLGHSSGLDKVNGPNYLNKPDSVEFAINSPVLQTPGTKFIYSNNSSNLVPLIVEKATGQPIATFAQENLFNPMGINEVTFEQDESGNTYGATGIKLPPTEFARLGQLVLDRGQYNGNLLIADSWFDETLVPSTESFVNFGLSWWLTYDDNGDFQSFVGDGSWGQQLIGLPESQIVAVRLFDIDASAIMLYRELIEGEGGYDSFIDFRSYVINLSK